MRSSLLLFIFIVVGAAWVDANTNQAPSVQSRCGTLRGRVVDANGTPVDRVRVSALALDHPPNMQSANVYTETDQKGEFSLPCIEPGTSGVYVSKEADYFPNTLFSIFPDKNSRLVIHIAEGQSITGFEIRLGEKATRVLWHVIDSVSRQSINTATLNICHRENPHNCRRVTVVDSGKGYSLFLPAVDFVVTALARGYSDSKPVQLSLKPASTRTVTISLRPMGRR